MGELLAIHGIVRPLKMFGIPDDFIEHGDQNALRRNAGACADSLIRGARAQLQALGSVNATNITLAN